MTKVSKAAVHYVARAVNENEQCKVCEHFRNHKRPNEGTCTIVLGRIASAGWCEEFKHARAT